MRKHVRDLDMLFFLGTVGFRIARGTEWHRQRKEMGMACSVRIVFIMFFLLLPSLGFGMTGWSMYESPAFLLERPERGAPGREVSLPRELEIIDSTRSDGAYWYQVTTQGVTGWLFQDALFVQTGGSDENEQVAKLTKALMTAREDLFEGAGPDGSWVRRPDVSVPGDEDNSGGMVMTWASNDTVIQTMSTERGVDELYFAANTAQAAQKFLGLAVVGLSENDLRAKLGEETSRAESTLRYEQAGGHVFFEFQMEQGVVTEVRYTFWPGNGMEFPERVSELRRFRCSPGLEWPQLAWLGGTKIRVRKAPSVQAEVIASLSREDTDDGSIVWFETRDRGEAWPWVRVEFKTPSGTYAQGWMYGQYLKYFQGEKDYGGYFLDTMAYEFGNKIDVLKKSLGPPKRTDEWEEEWPELRLGYQVLHSEDVEERYLARVKVSDPRWNLAGIRIGDSMESLQELVDCLCIGEWQCDRELKDGENHLSGGFRGVILIFENGVLSSLETIDNAAD